MQISPKPELVWRASGLENQCDGKGLRLWPIPISSADVARPALLSYLVEIFFRTVVCADASNSGNREKAGFFDEKTRKIRENRQKS